MRSITVTIVASLALLAGLFADALLHKHTGWHDVGVCAGGLLIGLAGEVARQRGKAVR